MARSQSRDYVRTANRYARDVVDGQTLACKWTILACTRHLKDLKRKTTKKWPYYFDRWWANDVCGFAEKLPHVEGEWGSETLVLQPWQVFVLASVFGWRRRIGQRKGAKDPRRFNTVYLELARKQGKSFLSSVIALYCLCCEGEKGPQVKVAATTGSQARIVFRAAAEIVRRTKALREAFKLEAMANSIPCWSNGGSIQPINAKGSTQDGLNPHLSIIDELHAHKDRSLFDVLKSARGARKNPLSWYPTTAGYNTQGVCYEQRLLLTKILEGIVPGDHYFGMIFTLDENDDPFDEEVWVKANPNLGVSVHLKEMRDYAQEAQHSPESLGEFKTKRLNLWLNAANALFNMKYWDSCGDPLLRPEQFTHIPAWIGADLADKLDIAAIVLLFWPEEGPVAFGKFYLPEELVEEKARKTGTHYQVWADEGLLTLTPGSYIDHNTIERDIRTWWDEFNVQEAVFDQFGSGQMVSSLNEDGLLSMIVHKNAKNFTDPVRDLEARLKAGQFRHDANPILRWMVSNCVAEKGVSGGILPKKETRDSPNKIDGVDALLEAWSRAMLRTSTVGSVYDTRGAIVV